jgi:hypothetical protein
VICVTRTAVDAAQLAAGQARVGTPFGAPTRDALPGRRTLQTVRAAADTPATITLPAPGDTAWLAPRWIESMVASIAVTAIPVSRLACREDSHREYCCCRLSHEHSHDFTFPQRDTSTRPTATAGGPALHAIGSTLPGRPGASPSDEPTRILRLRAPRTASVRPPGQLVASAY